MGASYPYAGLGTTPGLRTSDRSGRSTAQRIHPMAIVAVFEFPNDSVDKYEKVFEIGGSAITGGRWSRCGAAQAAGLAPSVAEAAVP